MKIAIENRQKSQKISKRLLRKVAQRILDVSGCPKAELSILIVDDQAIQELNRDYLGKDRPTNVISFSMREGEGTVLDHTCLLFVNNMWSGSKHDSTRVPLLTAGGLGGTLETGRVLDYREAGDENRKLCSLYLSLMHRMGMEISEFGDADTPLANL